MQLEQHHIDALKKASKFMLDKDFLPYLKLKELKSTGHNESHEDGGEFRSLFKRYYGLNIGGLTDDFKNRYFEILFSNQVVINGKPQFKSILNELSKYKNKRGYSTLQLSFVSKLVGIHQENSPIYDRHVRNFFDEKQPDSSINNDIRIEWFVNFLEKVYSNYEQWAALNDIKTILNELKERDSRLKECSNTRLLDFLVWKVGNRKLLPIKKKQKSKSS